MWSLGNLLTWTNAFLFRNSKSNNGKNHFTIGQIKRFITAAFICNRNGALNTASSWESTLAVKIVKSSSNIRNKFIYLIEILLNSMWNTMWCDKQQQTAVDKRDGEIEKQFIWYRINPLKSNEIRELKREATKRKCNAFNTQRCELLCDDFRLNRA